MIEFKLESAGVVVKVSVRARAPHEYASIEYVGGSEEARRSVRVWLEREAGAFGNLIGRETTPVDLDAAMKQPAAARFAPKCTRGRAIVARYSALLGDAVP